MKNLLNLDNIDIEVLVKNKENFRDFIYTPLAKVKDELVSRWENSNLKNCIKEYLQNDIPKPFLDGFKVVLFRQLFTPNYEFRHFIKVISKLKMEPIFFEYYDDKFTSHNILKHSLGKMKFQAEIGYKNKIESKNIINFNEFDGKKIKDVRTIWGQSLISFHHELLESFLPRSSRYLFDASEWFKRGGGSAKQYYDRYISLFIRNGILFENFILEGSELIFIKEVVLPSFIHIWRITQKKPIIVELLPPNTEDDIFWLCHPFEALDCIKREKVV